MTSLEGRVLRRRKALDAARRGAAVSSRCWRELAVRLGCSPSASRPTRGSCSTSCAGRRRAVRPTTPGSRTTRLDAGRGLHWPCPGAEHPRARRGCSSTGFATPDGRARFVAVDHVGPAEPTTRNTPLLATTGRVLPHYQSGAQTRPRRRAVGGGRRPMFVQVHPDTADAAGLGDGDARRRGDPSRPRPRASSVSTTSMRPDTVFLPFHCAGDARANLADQPGPRPDQPDARVQGRAPSAWRPVAGTRRRTARRHRRQRHGRCPARRGDPPPRPRRRARSPSRSSARSRTPPTTGSCCRTSSPAASARATPGSSRTTGGRAPHRRRSPVPGRSRRRRARRRRSTPTAPSARHVRRAGPRDRQHDLRPADRGAVCRLARSRPAGRRGRRLPHGRRLRPHRRGSRVRRPPQSSSAAVCSGSRRPVALLAARRRRHRRAPAGLPDGPADRCRGGAVLSRVRPRARHAPRRSDRRVVGRHAPVDGMPCTSSSTTARSSPPISSSSRRASGPHRPRRRDRSRRRPRHRRRRRPAHLVPARPRHRRVRPAPRRGATASSSPAGSRPRVLADVLTGADPTPTYEGTSVADPAQGPRHRPRDDGRRSTSTSHDRESRGARLHRPERGAATPRSWCARTGSSAPSCSASLTWSGAAHPALRHRLARAAGPSLAHARSRDHPVGRDRGRQPRRDAGRAPSSAGATP